MIECLIISAMCLFQDQAQEPATFRGGVWMPRLGGILKDGTDSVDLESNIQLHTKESSPLIEFEIDPFDGALIECSIFDFSTTGNGTYVGNDTYGVITFQQGDEWRGSTDIQSIGFTAALDYIAPYHASDQATLDFAPVIGLRWFGIETELINSTQGTSEQHQNGWVALQGGIEMQFTWNTKDVTQMVDSISITSELLVGSLMGDDGGSMWSIHAGVEIEFSDSFGGYFGYRLQELEAEDGDYTFDAGLQGLYVGGQIRF